ncbi:MAG: type II secretion system protein GspM [Halarsenatibacteraceae bacterium]
MISGLSRREKILLLIAFVAIVFAGYYYFLYQPIVEEQEQVQREIDNLSNQHALAVERVEQIPELEDELARLEEERAELLEAAIREPEEILAAINVFARETGITIEGYEKNEGEDGHPLAFAFSGEYLPFLDFARMVDNWDYRLVIESFSMDAEDYELNTDMYFFFHQPDEMREFIEAERNGE